MDVHVLGAMVTWALALGAPPGSGHVEPAASPASNAPPDVAQGQDHAALFLAQNAFEYRDFRKVIEILSPFVHPPRFVEAAELTKARELLGIAHHINNDIASAEVEFRDVLAADPTRRLDPFVVPPSVVETFERVRLSLGPKTPNNALDWKAPDAPGIGEHEEHAVALLLPFGLSHFYVLRKPDWGWLFLGLEVLGLSANVAGYHAANSLVDGRGFLPNGESKETLTALHSVQVAGIVLFATAWAASSIHALSVD